MTVILTHVAIVVGVLASGTAIIWVLQQRRSPQSALAWILFIVTVPYLGVPLFFALGVRKRGTRYAEVAFSPQEETGPPVHPLDDQMRRLGIPPATSGNDLTLEFTSEEARVSLDKLVTEARESLDVVLYRLEPDALGKAFVTALCEAVGRGVRVRLLLDQVGTYNRPRHALHTFRAAGGELRLFSPAQNFLRTGRLNLRNHRKMVIADGRVVWSGGRNVGDNYLGSEAAPGTWHDLSYRIEGPVVHRYCELFEADWLKEGGAPSSVRCRAEKSDGGTTTAQLIPSGPDFPHDGLHDALVHGIHSARERVWIATPYILPTDQLQHALGTAARLGRDVRLVVPAHSNQRVADFARGAYLRELEESGCQIQRFTEGMLHAKAVIFDDVAVVGSANLDIRSMLLNFESALAIYDEATVARLANWFTALEARTTAGTRAATLPRRLAEATFRLGAPIL